MNDLHHKILVVDDNISNLTMLSGILRTEYKVYPVDSGNTALRFLEKQLPDLILLDVEMPGMSGIELFEIIKSNEKFSDIPVIFLTANNDIESEAELFGRGAADYIRKPVSHVTVLARVKTHLELAAYRKAAGHRNN